MEIRTTMTTCINGHHYDMAQHANCPYCGSPGSSRGLSGTFPSTEVPGGGFAPAAPPAGMFPPTETPGSTFTPATPSAGMFPPTEAPGSSFTPATSLNGAFPPTEVPGSGFMPAAPSAGAFMPTEAPGIFPPTEAPGVFPPTEAPGMFPQPEQPSAPAEPCSPDLTPTAPAQAAPCNSCAETAADTDPLPDGRTGPVMGWLVCIEGPVRGRDFRVRSGYNYIGRDSGDVRLDGDEQIAPENHAIVTCDPDEPSYFIAPHAGHSLIKVNGRTAPGAVELKSYDIISIGTTRLLFIALCGEQFSWKQEETND